MVEFTPICNIAEQKINIRFRNGRQQCINTQNRKWLFQHKWKNQDKSVLFLNIRMTGSV